MLNFNVLDLYERFQDILMSAIMSTKLHEYKVDNILNTKNTYITIPVHDTNLSSFR